MDSSQTHCPWLRTPLGSAILARERAALHKPLTSTYGRHAAQLGCLTRDLLTANSMPHHLLISTDSSTQDAGADLYASADYLPLDQDSIDLLLLHHALETAQDPHGILREAARVLNGEGLLLILGFNPHSYWTVFRWLGLRHPPRPIQLMGLPRLCDWLKLLDLQVERVDSFFSLPPINNSKVLDRLQFMRTLDRLPLRPLHGLYLVQARKQVAPLTPTRLRWKHRPILPGGLAEPST